MWLRDLLPSYIPKARISTFGYRLEKDGLATSGIKAKAIELLDALDCRRSPDEVRTSLPHST